MARFQRVRPRRSAKPRPLPSADRWSAPVGVWAKAPVRVHVSLAVLVVLAAGACLRAGSATGWLVLAAYLVSLLVHEGAHVLATARLRRLTPSGREPLALVLGPVGAIHTQQPSDDPRERVFVAMAGPLASLGLVVASLFCLVVVEGPATPPLARPLLLSPISLFSGDGATTPLGLLAATLVAVNWPLFILNLAPASPFDGAAGLRSWLDLLIGERAARDVTLAVGLLTAALLLAAGGALSLTDFGAPWIGAAMAALAVIIAFGAIGDASNGANAAAWLPPSDDDYIGVSLRDVKPDVLRHAEIGGHAEIGDFVRDAFQEETDPYDLSIDRFDEAQVDDILAKVHVSGVHALTANERAVLERASQRYQLRRRNES
ncbi:Peptidase family M50 [Botrimarina colliarenosi]|uniref:Peptidase family M50 n=1 Tax=Botrimarina colliarenosi TaxID=2528001 RepID=A0A5C6AL79_9BACT|nr:hypothetical protein [Botrimarina colliarenosi]TWT99781.1 Peptidase family M50 [Botrimarina colliarenosi]